MHVTHARGLHELFFFEGASASQVDDGPDSDSRQTIDPVTRGLAASIHVVVYRVEVGDSRGVGSADGQWGERQ